MRGPQRLIPAIFLAAIAGQVPSQPGLIDLEEVRPDIAFTTPVALSPTMDGTGDMLVAEQPGRVWRFDPEGDAPPRLVAAFEERVQFTYEQGLLAVAAHPQYATNGQVFVYYTGQPDGRSVLSRIVDDFSGTLTAAAEEVLLEVPQPDDKHNGGGLAFGPDGHLYLALGDGVDAFQGDPLDNAQSLDRLLGKVLRIDVDAAEADLAYGIPFTNPFVNGNDAATTIIIESRLPNGSRTPPFLGYSEVGTFEDSEAKSAAPGLLGLGSRVAVADDQPTSVTFSRQPPPGAYDVFVTAPAVAAEPGGFYRISVNGGVMEFALPLTGDVVGDKWHRIRRNVVVDVGEPLVLTLGQLSPGPNQFVADAVMFAPSGPVRPEIYAFGVRNPWRLTTDRGTGAMYFGDVGRIHREEVNRLVAGGNYGWPAREGSLCLSSLVGAGPCDATGYHEPLHEYSHGSGRCSVTGGYVYRGKELPELVGKYIFADFCGGIYAVDFQHPEVREEVLVPRDGRFFVTLGETETGELMAIDHLRGRLYRLTRSFKPSGWHVY